jgi:hypothetical protein
MRCLIRHLVENDTSLGQTIVHAFTNFYKDVPIVNETVQFILCHNAGWDVIEWMDGIGTTSTVNPFSESLTHSTESYSSRVQTLRD